MVPEVVLASASPRRSQLLKLMGVPFRVEPTDADERLPQGAPSHEAAMALARRKAAKGMLNFPDALVIAADTIVVAGGRILGKPADRGEAVRMLKALRGRSHEVVTGLCVGYRGGLTGAFERTKVLFDHMSDADIDAYVRTGEPFDKAGAYGIQGRAGVFITGIRGCYYNVMGLPLATLRKLLMQVLGENEYRAMVAPEGEK